MHYVSTAGNAPAVDLEKALFSGPAPDGGLYVPASLPSLDTGAVRSRSCRFADTATMVATALFGDDVPEQTLQTMAQECYTFEVPLARIEDNLYALELFHGPTLAFKDVGARFMARLMCHFSRGRDEEATVLVATSGDTGSAVAHAFHRLDGFRVVVLFPRGKVSEVQRKLFTTLGGNVSAIAIEGAFDDCQRLVKQAFSDERIGAKHRLVSANSINVGRLLPQTFYYFHLLAQHEGQIPIISTPSGNFGNLTAGLLAKRMGLPNVRFVAATNVNDIVPSYLETGTFKPRSSVATLSNAMDVGDPSNFARMQWLYGGRLDALRSDVLGSRHSDEETLSAMREVYERDGYLMDPHAAVGYLGAREARNLIGSRSDAVFLATAHPGKFENTVRRALGTAMAMPETLSAVRRRKERVITMPTSYTDLFDYLTS